METAKTNPVGIVIYIREESDELTIEEARSLYESLHEIFGQKQVDFSSYPYYHVEKSTSGDPIF